MPCLCATVLMLLGSSHASSIVAFFLQAEELSHFSLYRDNDLFNIFWKNARHPVEPIKFTQVYYKGNLFLVLDPSLSKISQIQSWQ